MPEVQISDPQLEHDRPAMPSRDDIARNWGEQSLSPKPGRSARKRQEAVRALVRRMQAETRKEPDEHFQVDGKVITIPGRITGPLRPCTVVNFNPVALVVEGQLRITVGKPGSTEHHQIKMPYRGRSVLGHYCYLASPMTGHRTPDKEPTYYTVTTGHEVDSILPIDVPTVAARVFTPHSIACELWSQYNSASHKLMGGVLMFDQGPHALSKANLTKNGGRIQVPERLQMEDEGLYTYQLREAYLEEELDRIFATQREYCDMILQQAHTLWAEQDVTSRKMVTDTHREWARFAVSMGYLPNLPEWVNAKLELGASVADLRTCSYCGSQQANASVYFCPKCNAPYDAFKAFQAGRHVPEGYLMMLEGEELEIVLRTLQEKKSRFAALTQGQTTAPAAPLPPQVTTAPKPQTAAEKKAAKDAAKAASANQQTGAENTEQNEGGN